MNHLPLPSGDLAHRPINVPFLCDDDETSYDDLGFLTYPDRIGLDLAKLVNHPQFNPNRVARVLQAWLWFGLLGEILGVGSRSIVEQRVGSSSRLFADTDAVGRRVIRTTRMFDILIEASRKNSPRRRDGFHMERYYRCLQVAARAVDSLFRGRVSRLYLARGSPFEYSPVLSRVVLSIQILVETLLAAEPILFPEPGNALSQQDLRDLVPSDCHLVNTLLVEAGWCQYEIQALPRSIRLRYYLSFLRRTDPVDHLLCNRFDCPHVRAETSERDIKPKHVAPLCVCSLHLVRDSPLAAIAAAGGISLVTFAETDGAARRLEITQAWLNEESAFVAISHVRHAGLGNGNSHSLPYCQLARLQQMANRSVLPYGLQRYAHYPEFRMPFWLDTMCLPREEQARANTLERIRQIFGHASRTLVVDEDLLSHAVGSPEEALIRIRFSKWRRRLWTLQEGFVAASKLMFCFADGILSLRSLVEAYQTQSQVPFPLLSGSPFVGFGVLPHLTAALEMMHDNIRAFMKRVNVSAYQHMILKLRRMLRLGYLASENFMYFREDAEEKRIAKLLAVLDEYYLGPEGSLLERNVRSGEHILRGLHGIIEIP